MKKMVLKFGETKIACVPTEVTMISNAPKLRKGVIVDVSEMDGNTHIEVVSTDANRSRQELTFDIAGQTPEWAVLGQELEYQTDP